MPVVRDQKTFEIRDFARPLLLFYSEFCKFLFRNVDRIKGSRMPFKF